MSATRIEAEGRDAKQGSVHESRTSRPTFRTIIIPNSSGASLLIGEHQDKAFVAIDIDGKSRGGFWTGDEAEEIGLALYQMGRRIKRRGKV